MLTITALRSPAYLARIKAAAVKAVRNPATCVIVRNRKGLASLRVVWHKAARALEFFDRQDNDVTARVLAALRTWHAETRIPRMQVEIATADEYLAACLNQHAANIRSIAAEAV